MLAHTVPSHTDVPLRVRARTRAPRPRNHRGGVEILTEHGFMTVSSVYARERDRGATARREDARKESKRFRREGDE